MQFEGVYSEKILSILTNEKISVWRLKYSDGTIYGRMFAKDFKKIRKIRKNTDVKIRITEKHGFPFFWKRYSRRSGFLLGALIFFVLLKFLSTFIWVINVDGNVRVKSSDIIKTLNEIGVKEEMRASDIDAKELAQKLLIKREDLAWASLNIEGCVLNVNVSEVKKKPKTYSGEPSNLIAATDGIIKKVEAVCGDVKVKIGENVHKGDLLVSGIIESMSSTAFVKSNAVVIAQVEKKFTKTAQFSKSVELKTGKNYYQRIFEILGVDIPLFLPRNMNNVHAETGSYRAKLFGKKIPVTLYCRKLSVYEKTNVFFSEEDLKNQLSGKLKDFFDNSDIEGYIPIGTDYYTGDKEVTVSHRYLCDINIAEESKILLEQ